MSRVVVVGAGLAGLSAACRLAGAGHQVTVLERGTGPGGRAGRSGRDGFVFNTGPSVLTVPNLIDDAVPATGVDATPLIRKQLDPAYRAVFADGSVIRVRAGREAMREEIRRTCSEVDAAAFDDFADWLTELYRLEMPHFIDRNYDSPLDLLARPGLALALLRRGAFGRLGAAVQRRFRDERLHRLFSFQALYAGLAPSAALALFAVITYMDCIEGVWFPDGGMRAIPTVLADAAGKAGAVFRYSTPVQEIVADGAGRVSGVRLTSGDTVPADAVVCTADLPLVYRDLLPGVPEPRRLRKGTYSPSAVVWHVGVRGLPDESVAHHNVHFGAEWESAFDALLHRGTLMPDPSRLVTVPSLDDPDCAPPGCSTLFVLEPVPNLSAGIDWRRQAPAFRDRLAGFLAESGYPGDVVAEELVTPLDWETQGMAQGTPFSLAHTFFQSGPFRPANVDKRMPGLVLAGSGTVPGVGVPMVLVSGKLAAERVEQFLGRR